MWVLSFLLTTSLFPLPISYHVRIRFRPLGCLTTVSSTDRDRSSGGVVEGEGGGLRFPTRAKGNTLLHLVMEIKNRRVPESQRQTFPFSRRLRRFFS